jgi:hypothetical protein
LGDKTSKEGDDSGDLALAWKIILKHVSNICDGRIWIEIIWLGKGTRKAQVESGNDLSGFQKRQQ